MREKMSTTEAAKKWEMSGRRVSFLCLNGRIPGAEYVGGSWIMPADAVKPADARIKSGKYIKDTKRPVPKEDAE